MTNQVTDIYESIAQRTDGNIYIGVVGPVRTGKSTLIKRFMETMVLPRIESEPRRSRAADELPQSAAGRTIMTTEPKFIPEEAVSITLEGNISLRVRMIDCVGYIVPSALGYIENQQPRMVMTPWYDKEVPFNMAAEVGTRKVINEHSTIGLVVTTDGSISEIPRTEYEEAEARVVRELQAINKPFVVVLNCQSPKSPAAKALRAELEERYGVTILLSAQGQEACEAVWDAVVTTTDQWPLEDEPYAIARTLEALDRALALYPEGFFRQMRNTMGEGGVRFIPVGHIENDVNAVGLTYETYGWQNIYIDVTLGTFESVICHEIWHATEGVISYRDWVSFDPGNWSVCNPEGFFYNEDVEDADPNPSRWTFNYEMDAQNVYFVDAYARTNAKEDRARIMEYVMANEDLAGALMQSPYITQKLEIMCQAIRNSFDTSAWGDLRWERLLP